MFVSERGAAQILGGVGLTREQARVLLRTGVAGRGEPVGATTAYREVRVREVASRPPVDEHHLISLCPVGVYVARLGRHRSLDVTDCWEQQASAVAPQPRLTPMTGALLGVRIGLAGGRLPWVATVSGLVVFGGELTGWRRDEAGMSVAVLEPPGAWYVEVAERWFAFGRGRHWCLWDPWRLTQ